MEEISPRRTKGTKKMMRKPSNLDPKIETLAYVVIGCAIEVHRELGPGLLENIYEEALCIELAEQQILFERQKDIPVSYKGKPVGSNRIDILVEQQLILELKSVERLLAVHQAQVMTYLKITNTRLGLLINFNTRILKDGIKRIVL